jgi:hypothetical protein
MNYPTIVTMFYDIRKLENIDPNANRQKNKYFDLSKQFILKLPYPLVIFTDADTDTITDSTTDSTVSNEFVDMIHSERGKYMDRTQIIKLDLKDTYFYKYLDQIGELQNKFNIYNGDLNHETPLYIILNNNKFFFMETAIEKNPFNSSHFIWCDFGINHVALNYEKIHEWILFVPDKIKQLCINPYLENGSDKEIFHNIYHHMAGGLFSGSSENLLTYATLFKNKVDQIYNEEWYQIDEAIMTIVQRENPDLFDLFYGDYIGIISNYLEPYNSINLILQGVDKALNHNNNKLAYTMLNYCHNYFNNNENASEFYKYIYQRIITDYYNNDAKLKLEVIYLINKKILNNDENLIHLLNNNKHNLDFYSNKNLILFK